MGQVIDAGPDIGLVEFPEGMSDAEMSTALDGEMARINTMPSRRAVLPSAGDAGEDRRRALEELRGKANEVLGTMGAPALSGLEQRYREQAAPPGSPGAQIPDFRAQSEEALARAAILSRQMHEGLTSIEDPLKAKAFEEEMRARIEAAGVTPIEPDKGLGDVATTPLVQFPRVTGQDLKTLGVPGGAASVAAGVQQGLMDLTEFFTSPLGIATMGTAGLAPGTQRAIAGAFAVDMARQSPQLFAELGKAAGEGRVEDAVRLAIGAGANVYFAGKSAGHAAGMEPQGDARIGPAAAEMLRQTEEGKLEGGGGDRRRTIGSVPGIAYPEEFYRATDFTAENAGEEGTRGQALESSETGRILPVQEAPRADALESALVVGGRDLTAGTVGTARSAEGGEGFGQKETKGAGEEGEAEVEGTTNLAGIGVRRVKAGEIGINPDLMQFKRMDNRASGVNEEDRLRGKWDDLKAGNLLLWEPIDPEKHGLKPGQKYLIANGHHRLEFGNREGVERYNAQVVREADGFSAEAARTLGAEINIADGKGTIYDQAKFIRNEARTHGQDEAVARARQIGAKGRKAATIGLDASDGLFDSFVNEQVTPEQAEVIARSAPGDENLQRAGIQLAAKGKAGAELANLIQALRMNASAVKGEQRDLFGNDDSALREAEALARRAGGYQREIGEQIAAVQGAARRPEQAAKLGVNVADASGLLAKIEALKAERQRWENWAMHPDLVARVRGEEAKERKANPPQTQQTFGTGLGFASYGDYREDRGDLFSLSDEELGNLFRGGRASGYGLSGAADVAGDLAAREFVFRNYEEFRKWMDARYEERDLEGMKLAFAEADSKTKVQYIKENRGAAAEKKDWLSHIATGSPLPAGRPPVARTSPRPGGTGMAGRQGRAEARPQRDTRPMPQAPPRTPPIDPVSRVMGGMEYVRPVEMPEIVRLGKLLSGSEIHLRKLRAGKRGFFNPATGQVTLAQDLFKSSEQAAKTLAHEVGHLTDYLPERAMDRGNILGRLAVLRNWLTTTFPKEPGGGAPLTTKERDALRAQAKAAYPDDPAMRAAEYQRLLGEEINRRGLRVASEVWREAYELSKWWRPFDEERVPEKFVRYRKSSPEVYADAISVLLNAPEQLKARAPQFWEMFFNYLDKKPEVKAAYADLQDLLWKGPDAVRSERLAQSRAKFQTGEEILLEKIRAKEERRKGIKTLWRELRIQSLDHADELTRRVEQIRKAGIDVPQWKDPRNAWEESLFAQNRNHLDVDWVQKNVVKPVEDAGMDVTTLGQALELQRIIGSAAEGPREEVKAGPGPTAGTRVGIANPQGLDAGTAHDTLARLYAEVGPQRAATLEAATKRLRKLFVERAGEGWRAGIFSDDMYANVIVPNADSYAAFRSLDHIDTFVTPMARRASGTLKDIENPFITTMYKLASLNNLIATQRAKISARDFLKGNFAESWKDVETRWDGQKQTAVKRVADGLKRLEMLEGGRVVGYDVDPFVAAAFEKLTPANVSVLTTLLDIPFKNIVYPLIIKFNPAFQLFANPYRDFKRTSRNIGAISGMSRWQLLRNYVKGWQSAKAMLGGQLDPLAEEMLRSYAIGSPMESFARLERDDVFGEMMKRYKLGTKEEQNKIIKGLMWLPRKVEYAGAIFEALPKFATYRALVKEGVAGKQYGPAEAAAMVRNYAGTPNFRVKGLHSNVTNVLAPFLNIFLQGYRSDFKVATDPKTAGGHFIRWALNDGAASVLMGLAASGAMGSALKDMFGGASEYDKSNYTVVPLGWQAGGDFGRKLVYLRLPRDETSRFLSAAAYKATRLLTGDKAARKFPTEMFQMGAGIVPSISPLLRLASAWAQYAQGQDPLDAFRGRPIVPDTEWKAGGWDSLKPMLQYSLQESGVVNFFGWDPRAESKTELIMSALPLVKRMVKVSDYGYREQQREAQQEDERRKAIAHLDYSPTVRALLGEYYLLERIGKARTPAQDTRFAALNVWHSMYSQFDEASSKQEEAGQGPAAKETRKSLAGESERFEKEGKVDWPKWTPVWKP